MQAKLLKQINTVLESIEDEKVRTKVSKGIKVVLEEHLAEDVKASVVSKADKFKKTVLKAIEGSSKKNGVYNVSTEAVVIKSAANEKKYKFVKIGKYSICGVKGSKELTSALAMLEEKAPKASKKDEPSESEEEEKPKKKAPKAAKKAPKKSSKSDEEPSESEEEEKPKKKAPKKVEFEKKNKSKKSETEESSEEDEPVSKKTSKSKKEVAKEEPESSSEDSSETETDNEEIDIKVGASVIQISKNKQGLYVDKDSRFVFDSKGMVYGRLNRKDPTLVKVLKEKDIKKAKKLHFPIVPQQTEEATIIPMEEEEGDDDGKEVPDSVDKNADSADKADASIQQNVESSVTKEEFMSFHEALQADKIQLDEASEAARTLSMSKEKVKYIIANMDSLTRKFAGDLKQKKPKIESRQTEEDVPRRKLLSNRAGDRS